MTSKKFISIIFYYMKKWSCAASHMEQTVLGSVSGK